MSMSAAQANKPTSKHFISIWLGFIYCSLDEAELFSL